MYGGCQKKPCDNQTCVSPTNIELDPNYVGSQCYSIYKKYYNYYGSFTYADKWVTSAVEGTVFLEGGGDVARVLEAAVRLGDRPGLICTYGWPLHTHTPISLLVL